MVRNSRAACVVTEMMAGHRPSIWVSDLYGAQQGHADLWQVCLAHQLRDCKYAIEAGDSIFAPRMKALLLRAVVLARRRKHLADTTRRSYQLERLLAVEARQHAAQLSAQVGSRVGRDHGAGTHQPTRQAAAQTLRQGARPPFHLSGASGRSTG